MNGDHGHLSHLFVRYCAQAVTGLQNVPEEVVQRLIQEFTVRFWEKVDRFLFEEDTRVAKHVLLVSYDKELRELRVSIDDSVGINEESALLVIKNRNRIKFDTPLESQISSFILSDKVLIRAVVFLINNGLPQVSELIKEQLRTPGEIEKGVSRLKELSLMMKSFGGSFGAPDFVAESHKLIKEIVNRGADEDNYLTYIEPDQMQDSAFLNTLQSTANDWLKRIQKLCQTQRDISDGSIFEEMQYWATLQDMLVSVKRQLQSPEIMITISILAAMKRWQSTSWLSSDSGLDDKLKSVKEYNQFVSSIPLKALNSSESFDSLKKNLDSVAAALKRFRFTSYPAERFAILLEQVSWQVQNTILRVSPDLFIASHTSFPIVQSDIVNALEQWDGIVQDSKIHLREVIRKRGQSSLLAAHIKSPTNNLLVTLQEISSLRKQHDSFSQSLASIGYPDYLKDIDFVYEPVGTLRNVRIDKWPDSQASYGQRLAVIEKKLIKLWNDKLTTKKSPTEITELYCLFAPLMTYNSKLSSVMKNCQKELLSSVKLELDLLQKKLGDCDQMEEILTLKSLPPVSATVITRFQFRNHTMQIHKQCEALLGNDWEMLPEGRLLSPIFDDIMQKTDCETFFNQWKNGLVEFSGEGITSPVLKIIRDQNQNYELSLNFNRDREHMFGEVKTFVYVGFDVPSKIIRLARRCEDARLNAVKSLEQVQTFLSIIRELEGLRFSAFLLEDDIREIWSLISDAAVTHQCDPSSFSGTHDSDTRESDIPKKLESGVGSLLSFFHKLKANEFQLSRLLDRVSKPLCISESLSKTLIGIQAIVNELASPQVKGIDKVVFRLNRSIEVILAERLQKELGECTGNIDVISIALETNKLVLSPSVNEWKRQEIKVVENVLVGILKLPQIRCPGNRSGERRSSQIPRPFQSVVFGALKSIEDRCSLLKQRLEALKVIELLHSVTESEVGGYIGSDITICLNLLTDVIVSRTQIEQFEHSRNTSLIPRFSLVGLRLSTFEKLDFWHKVLCDLLLKLYIERAADFDRELRGDLMLMEEQRLQNDLSVDNIVSLLVTLQRVKSSNSQRCKSLECFHSCEKIFLQFHLKLRTDHLFLDHLRNDKLVLDHCFEERTIFVRANKNRILAMLEEEETRLTDRSDSVLSDWNALKPILSNMACSDALTSIEQFKKLFENINERAERLYTCFRALSHPVTAKDYMKSAFDDVLELESRLRDLSNSMNCVDLLLDRCWCSVEVSDIKKELERQNDNIAKGFSFSHQHQGFLKAVEAIDTLKSNLPLLRDLKHPALAARHWKSIFDKASVSKMSESFELQSFTLRDVLGLNLNENSSIIKETINSAQREATLQKSLIRIKAFWNNQQFDTFTHQSGMKLVKDWKHLQQMGSDDLEELLAMKHSTFYGLIAQNCLELESKLTAFVAILPDWIDVQFHWLDLYGILSEEGKLSSLLHRESCKFNDLTADFRDMLSRIFQLPNALDVLLIPGSNVVFQQMASRIRMLRSSLGAFLEQQRILFPRYYFLGDRDLLRLLGADGDLSQVSCFLGKMFGSFTSLLVEDFIIKGVYSAEGELLELLRPIAIDKTQGSHKWLKTLDCEIKGTLFEGVELNFQAISEGKDFLELIDSQPFQVLLLTWQLYWTAQVEKSLDGDALTVLQEAIENKIDHLSTLLTQKKILLKKKKICSLIVELTHSLKVVTILLKSSTERSVIWHKTQRFYYRYAEAGPKEVHVEQCGRNITYSFNYIGVPERLIYTSTMEEAFAALMEALTQGFGGCLFGPAGTGKTETIKSLSQNLGKMVLVFNCDDSFDFRAMARLLLGVAQIGAWGCFDELNRLDPNVLSSVTGPVETIQKALSKKSHEVDIMKKSVSLNFDTGLFVTLNPSYGGRSHLPENLKKRFREFSMTKAETLVIAEVIMRTLGFKDVKLLSRGLVDLFAILRDTCSSQRHYDFGLRSMKKVLQNCGMLAKQGKQKSAERSFLSRSLKQIVLPSFSASDENIFHTHFEKTFPDDDSECPTCSFKTHLLKACKDEYLNPSDELLKKCHQLYHMQQSQQAIILMGNAGAGKTAVWRTTLKAMRHQDGLDDIVYVIDTKTMGKDSLYGTMNKATLEWKDGVLTNIFRAVNDDSTGYYVNARIWIVLDSDLDPEYIETLNSALDDNKLLTLPTGERIPISDKIRLFLEVTNLNHATPATMTRCAILWIAIPTYSLHEQLNAILNKEIINLSECFGIPAKLIESFEFVVSAVLSRNKLTKLIMEASIYEHIMGFQRSKIIPLSITLFSRDIRTKSKALGSGSQDAQIEYMMLRLYQILFNVLASDTPASDQDKAAEHLCMMFDRRYEHTIRDGQLKSAIFEDGKLKCVSLSDILRKRELEHRKITNHNVLIPTLDTLRYEGNIKELLKNDQPMILCGPPGSGKTMLINNIFLKSKKYQLICMCFSKDTKVSHIFKVLNRHMKYTDGSKGLSLCPKHPSKNIVLFCDEVNLPRPDKYEAQNVILFLRLLIEKRGFWRLEDNKWISIERFHIIGACNPSTDPGRAILSPRFLRHICVLSVDYPSSTCLSKIYGSLIDSSFDKMPGVDMSRICEASICVYSRCQTTFTSTVQTHYSFSPRELTRWIRGIYMAVSSVTDVSFVTVLRIWAHEAWRIFADRLTKQDEKLKFQDLLEGVASSHFSNAKASLGDTSRLLFSSWLSSKYEEACNVDISEFLKVKMRLFCAEEGLDQIIIHDEFLNHVLRVDRALKQAQGHCMLIGAGRSGRSTMVKFVCWLNDIHFLQPSMHKMFNISDFDNLLRSTLLKCSVEDKKICLIVDESNIRETAFLERMNTLLANSDIPDLFQDEHYEILICSLKQMSESAGLPEYTEEELYSWFTSQVSKNLHIVFTMCDTSVSEGSQIVTSPALFNRCVIDWVGQWSLLTLKKVSQEFISSLPWITEHFSDMNLSAFANTSEIRRKSLTDLFLLVHDELKLELDLNKYPGFFVDSHILFTNLLELKCSELEKYDNFLTKGLRKLEEAVISCEGLSKTLKQNEQELHNKEVEAREVLDRILSEQNEAKRRQDATRDIRVDLIEREEEARQRRNLVRMDLKALEPIMQAAQTGVKNIKKQHLTEIRSMINPPLAVKVTLEAVCSILGYQISEWRSLQNFVRSDEFILSMLYFDAESQLSSESKNFVERAFLSKTEFTFEKVQRASKACGPLFQWVTAQVKFGDVLEKIEPLKVEARVLEDDALLAKAKLLAAEDMISELEESIQQSKLDYLQVIKDMELVRNSVINVQSKLARAKSIIEGLSTEKSRWERSKEDLRKKATYAEGNCFISSLIFTYFGRLDESQRAASLRRIFELLQKKSVPFDVDYDFVRENMAPGGRQAWLTRASSKETLFLSNFIMILDSNSVPYIIDPGLEVPDIMLKEYGSSLEIISFIEAGFVKKFINSARFGNMLLIKDAESYDPIINNVVTCIMQKTKTTRSIRIGDSEIPISPTFRLYLHSTDAKKSPPNFLQSRVRVINFSISKASIETRVVRIALAYEAPEMEAKRVEAFELNANYESKLRSLEHEILNKLSESKGSILENDDFSCALKNVKVEVNEISTKLDDNRNLIHRINDFSELYVSVVLHCTRVYSVLKRFTWLHWFYEIPSWQFFSCVEEVFRSYQQVGYRDMGDKLRAIVLSAYEKFNSVFSAFLSEIDGMRLTLILHLMYHHKLDVEGLSKCLHHLLELLTSNETNTPKNSLLDELVAQNVIKEASYAAAIKWMRRDTPDEVLIKRLADSSDKRCILLATDRRSDCSFEIVKLAESRSKNLSVIPLGSSESTDYAEQEISRCASEGDWVLLQNLQMSMPWVQSFLTEKIEQQLKCMDVWEKDFKIFMTCNLSDEPLPSVLLQQSHKMLLDRAPTVLDKVKSMWHSLAPESCRDPSHLRPSVVLNLLLVWFHAILDTRTQLAPMGFSKTYDFNDCDLQCGLACITDALKASHREDTVSICGHIRFSLGRIIYGGKVDEEDDLDIVQQICCQLFQPAAIEATQTGREPYEILPGVNLPQGPLDETIISQFLDHISERSDYYTSWLGLPEDALPTFEFKTIQQAIHGAITVLQ